MYLYPWLPERRWRKRESEEGRRDNLSYYYLVRTKEAGSKQPEEGYVLHLFHPNPCARKKSEEGWMQCWRAAGWCSLDVMFISLAIKTFSKTFFFSSTRVVLTFLIALSDGDLQDLPLEDGRQRGPLQPFPNLLNSVLTAKQQQNTPNHAEKKNTSGYLLTYHELTVKRTKKIRGCGYGFELTGIWIIWCFSSL